MKCIYCGKEGIIYSHKVVCKDKETTVEYYDCPDCSKTMSKFGLIKQMEGKKMVVLELSEFLKPEDVGGHNEIMELEFLNEGIVIPKEDLPYKADKDAFEISVRLADGREKKWTMNKTSQYVAIQMYGKDTANWIGKKIKVIHMQEMVGKELKSVLYAKKEE